jgi:surface protein
VTKCDWPYSEWNQLFTVSCRKSAGLESAGLKFDSFSGCRRNDEEDKENQDNSRNVAKSEHIDQKMSSSAVADIAASTNTPKDASRPGAFAVAGPGQMDDEVPLAARNPYIPAAVLVDEDRELERDEALERARRLQEERDEFAHEALGMFRNMTVAERVHALPAGNEEEVATEATGRSSRKKCIMIAAWCVSMIMVVTGVVATVLLSISSPADPPMERPTVPPTKLATPTLSPKKCFETTNELRDAVDLFMMGSDAAMALLKQTYGLPMGSWCVSHIQDFSSLFAIGRNPRAFFFNEDLVAWDVSKATTMEGMFYFAASFDQDLSSWNTSNVESMSYMFDLATSFNNDIAAWDVSKVSSTYRMFSRASSFGKDLCSWGDKLPTNVDVRYMFYYAKKCPSKSEPVLSANPRGPFCYACD